MANLLFVDDDRRLLQGVRRILADRRVEWEMTFANSGEQALALFELAEFDLVVSDLRMPGIDGVEVLAQALRVQPTGARMLLTGAGDDERGLMAAGFAQHVLRKPCDADHLRDVVSTALARRDRLLALADPRLERVWDAPPGRWPTMLDVVVAGRRDGPPPEDLVAQLQQEWSGDLERAVGLAWPALAGASVAGLIAAHGSRTVLQLVAARGLAQHLAGDAADESGWLAAAGRLDGARRPEHEIDRVAALVTGWLEPHLPAASDASARAVLAWALAPWNLPAGALQALTATNSGAIHGVD